MNKKGLMSCAVRIKGSRGKGGGEVRSWVVISDCVGLHSFPNEYKMERPRKQGKFQKSSLLRDG